jgi:hypothetical protein
MNRIWDKQKGYIIGTELKMIRVSVDHKARSSLEMY